MMMIEGARHIWGFDGRITAEIKHLQNTYLKFKGKMEKGFVDTSQEMCR
jgi:hypothetical protein